LEFIGDEGVTLLFLLSMHDKDEKFFPPLIKLKCIGSAGDTLTFSISVFVALYLFCCRKQLVMKNKPGAMRWVVKGRWWSDLVLIS
jgi:hypothetical protein